MTHCWSEGELRAHLDGELPAGDMRRLEEHLRGCPACAALHAAMAARAARVAELLAALPLEPLEVRPAPPRPRVTKRKAGAALGLAASLALAFVALPRRAERRPAPPPRSSAAAPRPATVAPAIIRKAPGPRPAPVQRKPQVVDYVALDNEPIDTGIVVRVALGKERVPADVIFGPDGRPRAIRLVNQSSGER